MYECTPAFMMRYLRTHLHTKAVNMELKHTDSLKDHQHVVQRTHTYIYTYIHTLIYSLVHNTRHAHMIFSHHIPGGDTHIQTHVQTPDKTHTSQCVRRSFLRTRCSKRRTKLGPRDREAPLVMTVRWPRN